jgi:hypothetical protein
VRAAPAPAQAIDIPDPFSLVGGAVSAGVGKLAVGAFDAIIKHLFAPIARFVTVELIGWLAAVPDFTQGNVAQLETTVCAMGGGLLGAVATISVARFWAAGVAGGGDSGFSALEGLARTVGAALLLAMWPWLFATAVNLANLASSGLLGSASVTDDSARLLAAGLGAAGALNLTPIGVFLNIAIAIAASLLFLGLLLLKIAVSVSTLLLFVGMPMAIVVWPVAPWVTRVAMRAFAVCLVVPFAWALCFAASAAVSVNVLSFKGGSAVMDRLLQPLVAIVLLWVMLKLPVTLARVAMLGGQALSGGFVSRAASYAAGRGMTNAAGQHVPAWAGGQATKQGETQGPRDGEGRTGGRLRNAANLAGAAAAAGATGGASAVAGSTAGATAASAGSGAAGGRAANGRGYTPPPTAQAQASGRGLQNGLQTPSFAGREQDFANEQFEAGFRARTSPVSGAQAREALRSLPEGTRRGVGQLVADHGAGAREHLAYQAMGEWTPDEREALRTLAAAGPDVRAAAIHDVLGDGDHDDPPVAMTAGGPGHTSVHEQSGGGTIDAGPEPPPRPAERRDVADAWDTTVEPSDPVQQPGPAGGREGAGASAPREPSASDPDTGSRAAREARTREPGTGPSRGQVALLGVHGGPDRRRVRGDLDRRGVGDVPVSVRWDVGGAERDVYRRAARRAGLRGQPDRV